MYMYRTVRKVNKEQPCNTATCTVETISTTLEDKRMHTHRVCSLQPITDRIVGPLNKRGCVIAGLSVGTRTLPSTFKANGSHLTQSTQYAYLMCRDNTPQIEPLTFTRTNYRTLRPGKMILLHFGVFYGKIEHTQIKIFNLTINSDIGFSVELAKPSGFGHTAFN